MTTAGMRIGSRHRNMPPHLSKQEKRMKTNDLSSTWHSREYTSQAVLLGYLMSCIFYIISSPVHFDEHELTCRGCDKVVSLITAFRNEDQIIAVLPYFAHVDFRVSAKVFFQLMVQEYYRTLSMREIRLYFFSLFSALAHVHSKRIMHRDIKPRLAHDLNQL
jgi:serine/threonine protein kinase